MKRTVIVAFQHSVLNVENKIATKLSLSLFWYDWAKFVFIFLKLNCGHCWTKLSIRSIVIQYIGKQLRPLRDCLIWKKKKKGYRKTNDKIPLLNYMATIVHAFWLAVFDLVMTRITSWVFKTYSGHPYRHPCYCRLTAVKNGIPWPVSPDCNAGSSVELIEVKLTSCWF